MRTVRPLGRRVLTTDAGSIVGGASGVGTSGERKWVGAAAVVLDPAKNRPHLARNHSRRNNLTGLVLRRRRRAVAPRSGPGSIEKRRRFRRPIQTHERAAQLALRRLVTRIGRDRANVEAPREIVVPLRQQIRTHL